MISRPEDMAMIASIVLSYLRLPFAGASVPGAILEHALAYVRRGDVLPTYDFADVICRKERLGWQVKSTKDQTPVTWKRVKLPDRQNLIRKSMDSCSAREDLGRQIIDFCNRHARESMKRYDLEVIGYSRLVMFSDRFVYFERRLIDDSTKEVFDPDAIEWQWSKPKVTGQNKEQLPALHGIHKKTGEKWFAWHGLGENQLHFSGERTWWPSPEGDAPHVIFPLPNEKDKMAFEQFVELLVQPQLTLRDFEPR